MGHACLRGRRGGGCGVRRGAGAAAHPLGNFTINHYDRITVSDGGIEVFAVLDMAEIPAFRERQAIDANGDGTLDPAEVDAYATAKADELRQNFILRVNGGEAALTAAGHELTFPAGQGGLSLVRLTATYTAALPADWQSRAPAIAFEDRNYGDRLGWREIIVRGGGGVRIENATAPSQDVSGELTAYPTDALSSPLDVRSASFSFVPAAGAAADPGSARHATAVRGNPDSPLARFADLIAKRDLSAGVIVVALLAAMGFGAIHALSPGHGKTIVAAYLVGSRGTAKHALLLGLTVTATHTSSVYVLGFISLYLSEYIVPERLYPWLTLASGLLIVGMGLTLLVARLRAAGAGVRAWSWIRRRVAAATVHASGAEFQFAIAHSFDAPETMMAVHDETDGGHAHGAHAPSDHSDDAHAHSHGEADGAHRHGFGPAHSHAVPGADGEPVTWRRLIGLGIFGGLLPCSSAIVVMLSAISLHRVGFGLVLIVAFSAGLAGVLTGIGFALVYGRRIIARVPLLRQLTGEDAGGRGATAFLAQAFPAASAAAVVSLGSC